MLFGREAESAQIHDLVGGAAEGRASALLVRGAPGIGKSALLEHTASTVVGVAVLRTAGLEAESQLPWAALHRLLRPALPGLDAIPPHQAVALRVALGGLDGPPADAHLVALATLSLLTEVSELEPLLCLVDDAHWLDAATAGALLFVARRLVAERVVMVLATRDDVGGLASDGVADLDLGGVDEDALTAILTASVDAEPSPEVVSTLAAQTEGNPLAVRELAALLSVEQLTGGIGLPATLPMTARLERAFLQRCRRLGPDAQSLLLLAALDDTLPASVLDRAREIAGIDIAAVDEVRTSGLITVSDDAARVSHPLVRSALRASATAAERRAAHHALATAWSTKDAERATWHRADAVEAPDAALAAELEGAAERARHRGGQAEAARALERAAELSPTDSRRSRLLIDAALCSFRAGSPSDASRLLEAARPITDDPASRLAMTRLRTRIEVAAGSASTAHRLFVLAARDLAATDVPRAVELAALGGVMHSHAVDSGTPPPALLELTEAQRANPRSRAFEQLYLATEHDRHGDVRAARAALDEALTAGLLIEDRDLWANLANMALHLGDAETHRTYFATMLAAARVDGSVMEILYALNRAVVSQFALGDWSTARRTAEEAESLAHSIGQETQTAMPRAWLALLDALQGKDGAVARIEQVERTLSRHPVGMLHGPVTDVLRWTRAVLAQGGPSTTEAVHHFSAMRVPVLTRIAATMRMNAAAQAGDRDHLRTWAGEAQSFADEAESPWAEAVAAHGAALTRDDVARDAAFEEALRRHERSERRPDAALTELAYGQHLRRVGKRVEARTHLSRAVDLLTDLDAQPMLTVALEELRSSGGTARKRDLSTALDLTPTERRIVDLVSRGMSNKDVAAECWISPRTVAFHLRNVFAKTGVTSRVELARLDLG